MNNLTTTPHNQPHKNQSQNQYDVAIIGSGIAGSTLAAILARQGLNVILFEAASHPKFAIGESMILETSEMMRSLSKHYNIPELAYFSSENYFQHIGTSHGIKRHFSYAHHIPNQPFNSQHILQAVIPKQPHGHELHLYRQDSDYFLLTVAIRYGATVHQNTPIQSVEINPTGVILKTSTLNNNKPQTFTANYVVDAGGFNSLLAKQFNLRHHNLQTHSRAIFTHMVNVSCFHDVTIPRQSYQIPFPLSEGTLHHVFDGGWLWVIPFNNHTKSTNPLCSVGLMLDPRIHPAQPDLSPETEFFQFIQRFPSIAHQFKSAKAVRNWTRTGRIQYAAKQVVGDRFCLLGQAAGFVDPLFSKGLYTALTCTAVLTDRLLAAKANQNYSATFFQPVEQVTQAHIQANDRLVAHAYQSFSNPKLWSAFSVLWLTGAYLELVKLTSLRALAPNRQTYHQQLKKLKQVGGGFADFDQLANNIYNRIDQLNKTSNEPKAEQIAQQISQQLAHPSWIPYVFKAILKGKNHLPRHKFHPRLFKPKQGFFGIGQYRAHFFANRSLAFFLGFYLRDHTQYAQPLLPLKRHPKHPLNQSSPSSAL